MAALHTRWYNSPNKEAPMSDPARRSLWIYPIHLLIGAFLAYEIAFLHNIPSPGGWIAFAIVLLVLVGIDKYALRTGVRAWGRFVLTLALAVLIVVVNSATTLTRCDKQHHCHRVFGI